MIRFSVYFAQPDDLEDFENAYNDFLALVEGMPNLRRRQVGHVIGSPQGAAPYFRSLEMYFNTEQELRISLMSAAGQEAGNELARFGADKVSLFYSEIYEEDGGSTPRPVNERKLERVYIPPQEKKMSPEPESSDEGENAASEE